MVISRVIIRVTPFRALITLLITYLLSPLPLQVEPSETGATLHFQLVPRSMVLRPEDLLESL